MSTRQLAAILFADIAGYTALMQADENQAFTLVRKFKTEMEASVPEFAGKVIQFYGDGCLVTFPSAVNALSCAKALQEVYTQEPKVNVRIGIHSGDILEKEGNIYGDAVNLASRVESMSVPGAVLFSESIHLQIKNKPEFEVRSLGDFEFKNVLEPVSVFALANEGFPVPKREEMKGKLKEGSLNESIAVLPFVNLSGNPDQEYFSDGITEEIIHSLAQIKSLKVVGRTSAFYFKGRDADLREIGEKLNVGAVLEGSVRQAGDRIRITAQLIKVKDGFHLWSERYDRQLTDVFEIQDEIARTIAEKLKVTLFEQVPKPASSKTEDMEAYQLYLKGRHFLSRRLEGYPKALEYFEKSIERDPGFAPAHFGLGMTAYYMAGYGMLSPEEGYSKTRKAAQKAIDLDPTLGSAYMLLAGLELDQGWNWDKLKEYIQKGVALSPGEVEVNKGMTVISLVFGDLEKATFYGKRASELEPVNPDGRIELVYCYLYGGEYSEALRLTQEMIELDPNYAEAYRLKGIVYAQNSQMELAIECLEKSTELAGGEGFAPIYLAIVLAKTGARTQAEEILQSLHALSEKTYVPYLFFAWIYGALGEIDTAFEWLEKSYLKRDGMFTSLNIEPGFDSLKHDPRFEEMVKRLNFPS